jgi:hypothetical protein
METLRHLAILLLAYSWLSGCKNCLRILFSVHPCFSYVLCVHLCTSDWACPWRESQSCNQAQWRISNVDSNIGTMERQRTMVFDLSCYWNMIYVICSYIIVEFSGTWAVHGFLQSLSVSSRESCVRGFVLTMAIWHVVRLLRRRA